MTQHLKTSVRPKMLASHALRSLLLPVGENVPQVCNASRLKKANRETSRLVDRHSDRQTD